MPRKLRERLESEKGFTLIELLVVILIIGILAAITLPAFLGQREKAQDAEAKAAVRTAATAMKAYYTENKSYADATLAELEKLEPSLGQGQGATLAISNLGDEAYRVTVTSRTGNEFSVNENNGVATRTCKTAGKAGCPLNGEW